MTFVYTILCNVAIGNFVEIMRLLIGDMSYPAINHLEVKLEQIPDGTKVTLRHRAIGKIDPAHREGVTTGWKGMLDLVKDDFSKAAGTPA